MLPVDIDTGAVQPCLANTLPVAGGATDIE